MFKSLRRIVRPGAQTVLGHRIPEPRPTWLAALWVIVLLVLPVFLLGSAIDLLLQLVSGYCTGFWCW